MQCIKIESNASNFLRLVTNRAHAFWSFWSLFRSTSGIPNPISRKWGRLREYLRFLASDTLLRFIVDGVGSIHTRECIVRECAFSFHCQRNIQGCERCFYSQLCAGYCNTRILYFAQLLRRPNHKKIGIFFIQFPYFNYAVVNLLSAMQLTWKEQLSSFYVKNILMTF